MIDPKTIPKIEFNERDFEIEWYSGTGAGGQHRNKHQNSCRITHIQSGVVATAQHRSRENSLEEAKKSILEKLNETLRAKALGELSAERKSQTGSGERGDKIRTYMFQHGKVTDHQTGKSAPCDKIMSGNFDLLW